MHTNDGRTAEVAPRDGTSCGDRPIDKAFQECQRNYHVHLKRGTEAYDDKLSIVRAYFDAGWGARGSHIAKQIANEDQCNVAPTLGTRRIQDA